ncbi:tryptophan-rich sensory protein [Kroppenstedtia sanguinis]
MGVLIITFSLIFLTIVGVIVLSMCIVPAIIAIRKSEKGKRPYKISYVVVGLLIFQWVFFLTGGYALLPVNVADALFVPVWLVLCVGSAITAIVEFKNNKFFSIPVGGLTIISFLFSILIYGIGEM